MFARTRLLRPIMYLKKATLITNSIKYPRTLFNMPKMMVHSRGYNNFAGDVEWDIVNEMAGYMSGVRNADDVAYVFDKFPELTVEMIAYGLNRVAYFNSDKNENFWNVVLPRVKKQLSTMDRYCATTLYSIIESAGHLQIQDNEFWEIVEKQLIDNRLIRYQNVDQVCGIVYSLSRVGRGSDELLEICEKYIIKHRKALIPKTIKLASSGFKELSKGSAVLFEVLGDPSRGLTQIE